MDENIFYDIVKNNGKFCHVDNEGVYTDVRTTENSYPIREVSDRNYGYLHEFFEQDYADIVSLDESYKDFMFCLQPKFFNELVRE